MSLDKHKKQREIIEFLQDIPFINNAVKRAGVARMTFYRWMRLDEAFARNVHAAVEEGRKNMNEIAESVLMKKVKEENLGAVKFYLENNHGKYMNRKFRIQTLPDRNYEDPSDPAHARIPDNLVLSEEETEKLRYLNEVTKAINLTFQEKQKFINMIIEGTFDEYIKNPPPTQG